jgi:hypothetical protein
MGREREMCTCSARSSLSSLLGLTWSCGRPRRRTTEVIVAESVVVIKRLLQLNPADHVDSIRSLARALRNISVAEARAAIVWSVHLAYMQAHGMACVCVCVSERERETGRVAEDKGTQEAHARVCGPVYWRKRSLSHHSLRVYMSVSLCLCVHVCVCVSMCECVLGRR